MNTDTDELIEKLAKDLKPVRPLLPAPLRAACLCALCLLAVFGGLFAVSHGLRPDIAARLASARFVTELIAIVAAGAMAAAAACSLSVPDTKIRTPDRVLLGASTFIWGALILSVLAGAAAGVSPGPSQGDCLTDLSLLMAAPVAAVFFMITRGAPVWRGWAGYATVLSAASFAALGMRFLCPDDEAGHLLVWHFLPVMGYAILGVVLGKILLRKKVAKI